MNLRKKFPSIGIKKRFKNLIIFLCRKDFTLQKLLKINKYSLFIFIFLYLTIGLHWKIKFFNPNLKVSVELNIYIWWTLILLQNSLTIFISLFRIYFNTAHKEYIYSLLEEKVVVVAYEDNIFKIGTTYKVAENYYSYNYYNRPEDGYFNGYYAGLISIEKEKVFKFISSQKNRKLKLKKLSNL